MDYRTIVGIVVCLVFYLVYSQYLSKKYPDYGKTKTEQVTDRDQPDKKQPMATPAQPSSAQELGATPQSSTPKQLAIKQLSEQELTIDSETSVIKFNQDMSAISSIKLKHFKMHADNSAENVELVQSPLMIQGITQINQLNAKTDYHAERNGNTLRFWRDETPWHIEQTITFPAQGYQAEVEVSYKNISSSSQELNAGLLIQEKVIIPEKHTKKFIPEFTAQNFNFINSIDGSAKVSNAKEYCEEQANALFTGKDVNIDYVGIDQHYFLQLFKPQSTKFNYFMQKAQVPATAECLINVLFYQPQGHISAGNQIEIKYTMYFGPKELDALAKADKTFHAALDFGWFGILGEPLLLTVKGFYKVTHNYGIAIIILTLLLKLLFYPLTRAAAVSMKKMQRLQPQLNEIRERYKDDRQKQQQELMRFMGQNKINPAKGCLPILPQIPVFIAFYNVLSQSIELRNAPFFGWIKDLSVADPYLITPVILAVGMFIQQKLTPNPSMDKTQQRIMNFMPVIFGFMMLSLPAGMVIYMITNTIVSIIQQQWLNRKLN